MQMRTADCGLRIADSTGGAEVPSARAASRLQLLRAAIRNPNSAIRDARGFTLLELMIVISIIIILAIIVLPQYLRTTQSARESVLRDDLFQMRKLIDQYAADKGQLPQSLESLVEAGYLREIPIDPMTEARDWVPQMGQDPLSADGGQGVVDVHSASTELGTDGRPYSEW
jgi:general secretion pathway protein G